MKHSLFELFKAGIGPSSSHTMGPMRAALRFAKELQSNQLTSKTASVLVDFYGSLALTGHGHGTDRAILLGLSGQTPEVIDPAEIETRPSAIRAAGRLELPGHHGIAFDETKQFVFIAIRCIPFQVFLRTQTECAFPHSTATESCCGSRSSFPLAAVLSSLKMSALPREPL